MVKNKIFLSEGTVYQLMFHALSSIQYNLSKIHFTHLTKYLEGAHSAPFLYISGMSMIILNIYFYVFCKCTYFCF